MSDRPHLGLPPETNELSFGDEEPPKNWWSRNWKWFLPVAIVAPILACGGFVTLLCVFVFGLMKSTGAYEEAVAAARAEPAVVAALGTPIEEGFLVTGNVEIEGSSGYADLAIPISGPRASGTIFVEAEKSGGQWYFSTLEVAIGEGDESINLLQGP